MHDSKLTRSSVGVLFLVAVMYGPGGCTMPPGPSNDEPPDIPPASTMVMDFSGFADEDTPRVLPGDRDLRTAQVIEIDNGNWRWAAIHVGVWSVLLTVGLAVPVAAFGESFKHQPEQMEDGTWIWSYDVVVSGITHSAELHALAVDGDIEWNMFITKDGFYESFNWFSGVSNLAGTSGTWTLNSSPDNPQPLLLIEWTRDAETDTGDIRYTNIVPDGAENGGYIFYGGSDGDYDTFYEIYNAGADKLINIEWNLDTGDGRVKDPVHFGDDAWRCWTADQTDTDC